MQEPKTQRKQGEENNQIEAEALKAKGNAAVKARNFKEAITCYGKAIELNPKNHVYYSNRAAAYINLTKFKEALVDANKCIEVHDVWARGYGRKGAALFGLKRYPEAIVAYQKALSYEPNSSHYKTEIESCKKVQKKKSGSSVNGMNSTLSYVIFFSTFLGHLSLIITGIVSILPTAASQGAYRQTLVMAAILQAVIVMQKHGIPKLEKAYWLDMLKNNEAHFILSALLCMMSRPFFLGIAGHGMRSALFIAKGMQDLIQRGPRMFAMLNQPLITENLNKLLNLRPKVYDLVASMEVIIGFMLVIEMLTPGRNIFMLFAWWQYLRTRYVLSNDTQNAFAQIRYKLDEWLLDSSWCPTIVGTVYSKIKSFLASSASPEAANLSSCSVM